ncbi:ribonuclease P protein component [Xanthobacter sp. ZOL 2024]
MRRGGHPIVDRLRKRRDFVAAAKALRAGVPCFLMQGRDRGDGGDVRIGFTVTKKTGNAVVRNRIRRRLREAVRGVVPAAGRAGHDYVLVAREAALHAPFETLVGEVERALRKLHDPTRPPVRPKAARSKGANSASGRPAATPGAAPPGRPPRSVPRDALAAAPDDQAARLHIRDTADATASGRSAATSPETTAPSISDPKAGSADGGHPA